jgi:protein-S-isoprenylcysteine O-methyltransferase Ste14
MLMLLRHLASITALPVVVTVIVPFFLARRYDMPLRVTDDVRLIAPAVVALAIGLTLFVSSLYNFATRGRGTLAPWDPPKNLVVTGPYRYVRNPMISGVVFILAGEAFLLASRPHAMWALIFTIINLIYIPLLEEPMLEQRFGDDYREYCRHVPRILPRVRPWKSGREA